MAVTHQPGYGYAGGAVTSQPFGGGNVPPGLEYLSSVDQLLVKQKTELLEAFTGFETNNKYKVLNSLGQDVFYAVEDNDCCTRNVCGSARPFEMNVLDNHQVEVMHLSRPLRCSACCFPCCLQKLIVEAPKGTVIGIVRQAWSLCFPRFKINNAEDQTMLRMKGPLCQCAICGDIEFEVTSPDEESNVGKISKQWSGLAKEIFTDADNFGVTFPQTMDVKTKATTLAAAFLIDFMFFENNEDKNKS